MFVNGFEISKIRADYRTECYLCNKTIWNNTGVRSVGDAILPFRIRGKENLVWGHAVCVLKFGIYEPTNKPPVKRVIND